MRKQFVVWSTDHPDNVIGVTTTTKGRAYTEGFRELRSMFPDLEFTTLRIRVIPETRAGTTTRKRLEVVDILNQERRQKFPVVELVKIGIMFGWDTKRLVVLPETYDRLASRERTRGSYAATS